MNIRRILLGAFAALVLLSAVAGCGSDPEPIKIGVLSGLHRELDKNGYINGMQLSIADINKRGVNGRMIELEVIEVRSEPGGEQAVLQALDDLERIHKPLAYISFDTGLEELTTAFAEEHEVVHLSISLSLNPITGREWAFEYRAPLESYFEEGSALMADLEVKHLTFLFNRDQALGSLFPTITPEMVGVSTIDSQPFGNKDTDFRTQIRAALGSDAIFIYSETQEQAAEILRQIRELDYQGHIVSAEASKDPNNPDLSEFIGVYATVPIIYLTDFLFAQDVRERYHAAYDTTALWFFNEEAAEGYDSIRLIAELLEGAEPTREHLKTVLAQGFSYDGIFGNITLLPGEHTIAIPLHRAQYVEGGLKYLE